MRCSKMRTRENKIFYANPNDERFELTLRCHLVLPANNWPPLRKTYFDIFSGVLKRYACGRSLRSITWVNL
jgi:hypothetical protein